MSQSNKSFLDSLRDLFRSLFGSPPPVTPPPEPVQPPIMPPPVTGPVVTDEPLTTLSPRVLVIVYDPIVDAFRNLKLTDWGVQTRGWKRVDELISGYIADVAECSGGLVQYNVVERVDVPEFPVKLDGFRYNALDYLDMYTNHPDKYHQPDRIDYHKIIDAFHLGERVNNREIDEVWLFTFPFSGTFESIMCGTGAFWCNSEPLPDTPGRRYVIMGFSYERGVGEMEEDLGHRTEALVSRLYGAGDFLAWTYDRNRDPNKFDVPRYTATNDFAKFLLYDKIAPGQSQCGNVHYAPNSASDYDWGNTRPVPTFADDWLTFPNLPGVSKVQTCTAWGNGDIRGHHKWWFTRFPKAAGRTNSIRNNWWAYICDVTNPEFDPR